MRHIETQICIKVHALCAGALTRARSLARSRADGFGEDEDKDGDKLAVQLSGDNLVAGVNDALVGMQPGGRRRVLVRPERGWRRLDGTCAEGEKSLGLDAQKLSLIHI